MCGVYYFSSKELTTLSTLRTIFFNSLDSLVLRLIFSFHLDNTTTRYSFKPESLISNMHFSQFAVVAALAASVSAHGVVTKITGANGVSMPGLTVADGTPRDCSSK